MRIGPCAYITLYTLYDIHTYMRTNIYTILSYISIACACVRGGVNLFPDHLLTYYSSCYHQAMISMLIALYLIVAIAGASCVVVLAIRGGIDATVSELRAIRRARRKAEESRKDEEMLDAFLRLGSD